MGLPETTRAARLALVWERDGGKCPYVVLTELSHLGSNIMMVKLVLAHLLFRIQFVNVVGHHTDELDGCMVQKMKNGFNVAVFERKVQRPAASII